MRNKKYNLLELKEYRKDWIPLKTELMPEYDKNVYINRKKAVDMYIDDFVAKEIENATNINHNKITRYISQCTQINPSTGKQYGYAGLIPNKKINSSNANYVNNNISKTKGSFKDLLLKNPGLESFIQDLYFGKAKEVLEKRITPANLHRRFLEECRRLKIQEYEYPFNTKDKAQRTFYAYLKNLENEKSSLAISRENKDIQQKFRSTGQGKKVRTTPLIPFSTVQLDGHKIDILYTVDVVNKNGEVIPMPAMRMWLIAVIDVATRAILGYSLTSNENYNQTDVLRAIRNSIIPKQTLSFTLYCNI